MKYTIEIDNEEAIQLLGLLRRESQEARSRAGAFNRDGLTAFEAEARKSAEAYRDIDRKIMEELYR